MLDSEAVLVLGASAAFEMTVKLNRKRRFFVSTVGKLFAFFGLSTRQIYFDELVHLQYLPYSARGKLTMPNTASCAKRKADDWSQRCKNK